MPQHTPGPWNWYGVKEATGEARGLAGPKGEDVLDVEVGEYGLSYSIDVSPADMALIEAAPELLEELKRLVELVEEAGWHGVSTEIACEVIAKATSQTD